MAFILGVLASLVECISEIRYRGSLGEFIQQELNWHRRPLVYTWKNGVTVGIALERGFHQALRHSWRRGHSPSSRLVVPQTMRFSTLNVPGGPQLSGTLEDAHMILAHCRQIKAEFYVEEWHSGCKYTPSKATAYSLIFGKRRGKRMLEMHKRVLAA